MPVLDIREILFRGMCNMESKKDQNMFINPTSDIVIKYLLGAKGTEKALLSFINAVLEDSQFEKIISLTIKSPFNIKNFITDKATVLDINVTDKEGKQFNIEVQTGGNQVCKNRSLYYWSRLYSNQIKESEIFKALKPVVCINLLEFNLFEETEKKHTCFRLIEKDDGFTLTNHITLHFLELSKLKELQSTGKLGQWLVYFKCEGRNTAEEKKVMSELLNKNGEIRETHKRYQHFVESSEMRDLYEARVKLLRDYNQGKYDGYNSGIEQGRKEGKKEGIEQTELLEKQNILIRLLSKKFKISDKEKKSIRKLKSPELLDRALDKVLFTDKKDDIMMIVQSGEEG